MGTVLSPAVSVAATAPATLRWWLKDPLNPAANMQLSMAPGIFTTDATDRQSVWNVLGRPDPVVTSDTFGLPLLTMTFVFTTDPEYQAFEALRSTQHVLLLQGPNPAGQYYIRFGQAKHDDLNLPSLRGWATSGFVVRNVQISAQTVAAP